MPRTRSGVKDKASPQRSDNPRKGRLTPKVNSPKQGLSKQGKTITPETKVLVQHKQEVDGDDSIRRSGRKRVVSSRLQDMEVTMKSPKSSKRQLQIGSSEKVSTKKQKTAEEVSPISTVKDVEQQPVDPASLEESPQPTTTNAVSLADDLPTETAQNNQQANLSLLMECDDPDQANEELQGAAVTSSEPVNTPQASAFRQEVISCISITDIIDGNIPIEHEPIVAEAPSEAPLSEHDREVSSTGIMLQTKPTRVPKTRTQDVGRPVEAPLLANYLKSVANEEKKTATVPVVIKPADAAAKLTKSSNPIVKAPFVASSSTKWISPTVEKNTPTAPKQIAELNISVPSETPDQYSCEEDSTTLLNSQTESIVIMADGRRYILKQQPTPTAAAAATSDGSEDTSQNDLPNNALKRTAESQEVDEDGGDASPSLSDTGEVLNDSRDSMEEGEISYGKEEYKGLEEGEVSYSGDQESASILIVDANGHITNIQPIGALSQDECIEVNKLLESSTDDLQAVSSTPFTSTRQSIPRANTTYRSNIDEPFTVEADGKIHCKKCPYVTDKKANWYKHKNKHLGMKNYVCAICEYKCATSSNLTRHMLVHSGVKQYECDICGAKFRQKIHATRHKEYKHQDKREKCELCDYRCSRNGADMALHIKRKHSNDTSYACSECNHIAGSRKDLRQHMKFHQQGPELKLFCESCSFVTDCQSRLKRHTIIHTREKPFKCGLCDYAGSQKEHVLRHMRCKHKEELGITSDDVKIKTETEDSHGQETAVYEEEYQEGVEQGDVIRLKTLEAQAAHESDPADQSTEQVATEESMSSVAEHQNIDTATHALIVDQTGAIVTPVPITSPSGEGQVFVDVVYPEAKNKKRYPVSDYRTKDKFFACNYCTMKFTKLINLYKHVNQQHNYASPSGDFSCVICDYKTTNRKNLLVHMRKHNPPDFNEGGGIPAEQADPNLLVQSQHLFKCNNCGLVGSNEDIHTHMQQKKMVLKDGGEVQLVIACSSLDEGETVIESRTVGSEEIVVSAGGSNDTKTVLLQVEPGISPVPVQVAVASETEETVEATQQLEEEIADPVIEETHEEKPDSSVQIAAEQLMELSSGDLLEINGETYTVEFSNSGEAVVRS